MTEKSRYNPAAMSIRVIGINHKTAPVAVREKVAFTPDGLIEKLQSIPNDTFIWGSSVHLNSFYPTKFTN